MDNKIMDYLKLPKLSKDDTFIFGCNNCGKCCREREDILLTPLDLFKIAKYLDSTIEDVLEKYCEGYEGRDSKIPIVRLRPKQYRKTCPFLSKSGCHIHPVKPAVCAIYPLGRITDLRNNQFTYFVQSVTCGNKNQSQTVRQWLDGFSILEEESFTILWHKQIGELSTVLREIYDKINLNHDRINSMLLPLLYLSYNSERDFLPQFTTNIEEALRIVKEIKGEAEVFNRA